jgi:hypothetical protein
LIGVGFYGDVVWKLGMTIPKLAISMDNGERRVRNLAEGVTIKFGVTKPSNNNVIHFKIFPSICFRTTLIAPTASGGHKAFYQTEQHFML